MVSSFLINNVHISDGGMMVLEQHVARNVHGKRWPLCATWPYHRGFTVGCPVAIRSFILFHPEKRRNSAQHCRSTITPLGL